MATNWKISMSSSCDVEVIWNQISLITTSLNILIYIQQDATLHSLFYLKTALHILVYPTKCNLTQFILSGNCSTYFGWYLHPPSGAQTTVSTASGICHSVTAICRYRGRVGTGLSVLWVAYATHNTLKPVPTLPQYRQIAVMVWQIPDAVEIVVFTSDEGWKDHSKYVEQFPDKISCVTLHLVGYILEYSYHARTHKR
jgi:hypothetical protein